MLARPPPRASLPCEGYPQTPTTRRSQKTHFSLTMQSPKQVQASASMLDFAPALTRTNGRGLVGLGGWLRIALHRRTRSATHGRPRMISHEYCSSQRGILVPSRPWPRSSLPCGTWKKPISRFARSTGVNELEEHSENKRPACATTSPRSAPSTTLAPFPNELASGGRRRMTADRQPGWGRLVQGGPALSPVERYFAARRNASLAAPMDAASTRLATDASEASPASTLAAALLSARCTPASSPAASRMKSRSSARSAAPSQALCAESTALAASAAPIASIRMPSARIA